LPYVLRPKGVRPALAALLGAAAFLVVPAAAQAACPTTPTTKPFAAFGDSADYSLAPSGAFESGAGGWVLSGASVTAGNESYKVHGASDAKSLALKATGQAVSPAFCVSTAQPTFRFFAKRTSGTWGVLNVKVRWTGDNGQTNETVVGSVTAGDTSWHPTQVFSLSSVLGQWNSTQATNAQLVLDPEDYGGNWAIDDVYIDPYVRG
jgi:hypothetical protein